DLGVAQESAHDLDQLLAGDGELPAGRGEVDLQSDLAGNLAGALGVRAGVAAQPHGEVLQNREVGEYVRLLRHHVDAVGVRLGGAGEHGRHAAHGDGACGRLVGARDDLDER